MADVTPSASYSVTLRLEIRNQPGMLGKVTSEIGVLGGDLGAIDIVSVGKGVLVRDVTVNCRDVKHDLAPQRPGYPGYRRRAG